MSVLALACAVGSTSSLRFFSVVAAFARCRPLMVRIEKGVRAKTLGATSMAPALVVGIIGITTVVTAGVTMAGVTMAGVTVVGMVAGVTIAGASKAAGDQAGDQAAVRPETTTSLLQIKTLQTQPQSRCRMRQRLPNVPMLPVWCGECILKRRGQ